MNPDDQLRELPSDDDRAHIYYKESLWNPGRMLWYFTDYNDEEQGPYGTAVSAKKERREFEATKAERYMNDLHYEGLAGGQGRRRRRNSKKVKKTRKKTRRKNKKGKKTRTRRR
tara:strand:+ start:1697 stop:2038 length:342 start_codon:yes stop_codon:yes gene_type:complete